MKKQIVLCTLTLSMLLSACASKSKVTEEGAVNKDTIVKNDIIENNLLTEDITAQSIGESVDETTHTFTPDATEAPASEESIGEVSFTPNSPDYAMVYGDNILHAYFKRHNVLPGTGKMTIRKLSDDSLVEEINLLDNNNCGVATPDSTFDLLGWNGGTHLIIKLNKRPQPGESYYVNLEEGAFVTDDGQIASKAVTDAATWRYDVATYGVIPQLASGSPVYVGDTLYADILVRSPAAVAKIENYDENRVRFNEKEFKKDGKLEIRIYQLGDDPFTVNFYDNEKNRIGSLTLTYTASMPPEPEEEKVQKAVTNL